MILGALFGAMASMVSMQQVLFALCHSLSLLTPSLFPSLSKNEVYWAWLLCLYGNTSSDKQHWRQCFVTHHQSRLSNGKWQGALLNCRYHRKRPGHKSCLHFFLMWINVCYSFHIVIQSDDNKGNKELPVVSRHQIVYNHSFSLREKKHWNHCCSTVLRH